MVEPQPFGNNSSFMKIIVEDPLRRREEFAISLRKKKKQDIIAIKRKRLLERPSGLPSQINDGENCFDETRMT